MRSLPLLALLLATTAASSAFAQTDPQSLQGYGAPARGLATPQAPSAGAANPYAPVSSGAVIDSQGAGAIPALPLEVMNVNGITYITGGVGDEEEAELKAKYNDFNLHLLMSAPGGAYVGDITLRITDKAGNEVLAVPAAGPYFYAELKPGSYKFEMTTAGGTTKNASIAIPAKGGMKQSVVFNEAAMD